MYCSFKLIPMSSLLEVKFFWQDQTLQKDQQERIYMKQLKLNLVSIMLDSFGDHLIPAKKNQIPISIQFLCNGIVLTSGHWEPDQSVPCFVALNLHYYSLSRMNSRLIRIWFVAICGGYSRRSSGQSSSTKLV